MWIFLAKWAWVGMLEDGMTASSRHLNLSGVRVRGVRPEEEARCEQLLGQHHYLREAHVAGNRGWQIAEHDYATATLENGDTFRYNRIIIENRGVRQLVYYWYDQRGRKVANEFVMKSRNTLGQVRLKPGDSVKIGWHPQDARALDPV